MLALGLIVFATPWVLTALVLLPVIWRLLRVTPPPPRVIEFPAIRLLVGLSPQEETPARTPWWLMLLRLLIVTLIILGLARPLYNPQASLAGSGPLLLVVDNGWASGQDWPTLQRDMAAAIQQAARTGRDVVILPTAPDPASAYQQAGELLPPAQALQLAQRLEPVPWPTDREATLERVNQLRLKGSAYVIWLSDGLDGGPVTALTKALQGLGQLELRRALPTGLARILLPPLLQPGDLVVRVLRPLPVAGEVVGVRANAANGRLLTRAEASFADDALSVDIRLTLPAELRNDAVQIVLENRTTAGAVVLLDDRWQRHPVGLVSGRTEQDSQPLLSDIFYLDRALSPTSDVRRGTTQDLLRATDLSVLILSDVGAIPEPERNAISRWVEDGGTLIRFAGPRMALATDPLVPVRLRPGERQLGGALSWDKPKPLAAFPPNGVFAGLTPPDDVTISRQILAEPTLELVSRTWASLADGTPIVTAAPKGKGEIVLIHTSASPDWSNLPLSGLFVEMLRRITIRSQGRDNGPGKENLAPLEVLDGYGRRTVPAATALPINGLAFAQTPVTPQHPPGFYGHLEGRRALNLTSSVTKIAQLPAAPASVYTTNYGSHTEIELQALALAAALVLLSLDLLLFLWQRRLLWPVHSHNSALLAVIAICAAPFYALAQSPNQVNSERGRPDIISLTSRTWIAYVLTGDSARDELTHAGITNLSQILDRRTSVDAPGAVAVDLTKDDLSFFPLLYWPITKNQPPLSNSSRIQVNYFLHSGGTILFDMLDQGGDNSVLLRVATDGLDIPPLVTLPSDHVLTKSFYLLQEFPGRYNNSAIWVQSLDAGSNDGVSPVIIGSNDWAAAWAVDEAGRPMVATMPGGDRQRELALRFGINLMMYVLTGNYKADQVHVPAILERLGQ